MAKSDDLIKYITQRVVTYIDSPKAEMKDPEPAPAKEPWEIRWFGMLPMALHYWKGKIRKE